MLKTTFRRFAVLLGAALALAACSGSDGAVGPAGPAGSTGSPGPTGPAPEFLTVETCALCHGDAKIADVKAVHGLDVPAPQPFTVTVNSATFVNNGANIRLEVDFTVMNGASPVTNITAGSSGNFRINLARLRTDVLPSVWANYIGPPTSRPSTENDGTLDVSDAANGNYVYRFSNDVQAHALWNGADTHRIGIQISSSSSTPAAAVVPTATNATYDFVPNGGALPATRDIVATSACNECHEKLQGFHGNARYETKYCVTCHTPDRAIGRTDPSGTLRDGEVIGDFKVLIHKIHMSHNLGKDYTDQSATGGPNYSYAGVEFNEITYPQPINNCLKCHKGASADAWKTNPSIQACQSCHDNISFVSPPPTDMTLHTGGVRTNSSCAGCHDPATITAYHVTEIASPNSPGQPAGAANFEYQILDVTADTNSFPVVTFRIKKDGVDVTTFPIPGFDGGPSFLVAYASPQDDVAAPIDWNNLGRTAGQPASVRLSDVIAGATNNGDGTFTATLTSAWPTSAVMRGVALQGYWTQTSLGLARHTPSVAKGVTGDPQRRVLVDNAKCLKCHEALELHGGNRVNETQVCVMCHNPNLSSSGRGADPANVTTTSDVFAAYGDDPLVYPEDTNNFKDLIHGIHGSDKRDVPYEFVRDRGTSGVFYYDWSHVTFPGVLNNCLTCHLDGTYEVDLPAGTLMSTTRTTTGVATEDRAAILGARASVPNGTDVVKNPTAAACNGCHTNALAVGHMQQNGGGFGTRSVVLENR